MQSIDGSGAAPRLARDLVAAEAKPAAHAAALPDGVQPVREFVHGSVPPSPNKPRGTEPSRPKKKGRSSARRGSWFGTYRADSDSGSDTCGVDLSPTRTRPKPRRNADRSRKPLHAAHNHFSRRPRPLSASPRSGRPYTPTESPDAEQAHARPPLDPRAASAEMMSLTERNAESMGGRSLPPSRGGPSRASRASESSTRRGSYFGTYKRPEEVKARMQSLAAKFYGRPHVVAPATRRYSYLNPDDVVLTAMDSNLEARRHKDMERQEELVSKTLERHSQAIETTAKQEALRRRRQEQREAYEAEQRERASQWATQRRLKEARDCQAKAEARQRRMEELEDLITRKQHMRAAHQRELDELREAAESDRRFRAEQEAKQRAMAVRQRAMNESNRQADKAYQAALRAAERKAYEDATRWSLEEARAREDLERHTRRLLLGQADVMRPLKFKPTTNRARRRRARALSTETCEDARGIEVGDVIVTTRSGQHGVVRFVGNTFFAPGVWVGTDMDNPVGKHDGMVLGHRYFVCRKKHGLFLRPDAVDIVEKAVEAEFGNGRFSAASSARRAGRPASTQSASAYSLAGMTPSPASFAGDTYDHGESPAVPPAPAPTPAEGPDAFQPPAHAVLPTRFDIRQFEARGSEMDDGGRDSRPSTASPQELHEVDGTVGVHTTVAAPPTGHQRTVSHATSLVSEDAPVEAESEAADADGTAEANPTAPAEPTAPGAGTGDGEGGAQEDVDVNPSPSPRGSVSTAGDADSDGGQWEMDAVLNAAAQRAVADIHNTTKRLYTGADGGAAGGMLAGDDSSQDGDSDGELQDEDPLVVLASGDGAFRATSEGGSGRASAATPQQEVAAGGGGEAEGSKVSAPAAVEAYELVETEGGDGEPWATQTTTTSGVVHMV